MAVDWSKQISFSGLKKRTPKAKVEYPSKTHMNLMIVEKSNFDVKGNIPAIVAIVLVVVLFMKFGVFDFYARVDAKQAELSAKQTVLASLTTELMDYSKVLEEYEGYESMSISENGTSVDVLEVFALIDRYISPVARVGSMALTGNTLSLNLTDITLDGVGKLSSTLYQQDIVANVSVSTAATQQTASEDVVAAMTITLVTEEKE